MYGGGTTKSLLPSRNGDRGKDTALYNIKEAKIQPFTAPSHGGGSLVWPAIDLSLPPTPIGAGVSMSVGRAGCTLVVLGQRSHEVAL